MNGFLRALPVVGLLALGGCVGVVGVPNGSTGAAGTTGTAGTGTPGVAGTTGTAGTGTPGVAGTTGAAGATGTAGTGTTGVAGTTGAGGRGGTTGAAGTMGAAGRGGSTGAAGRGGAAGTGTAGTTGTGGTTTCTITAQSSLATIPTVGVVTWSTTLANLTGAEIDFGLASTGPTMAAPVDLTQASYRTLLLGMKGSSSYVYRIVAKSSSGNCTSQDYPIMTGAVPGTIPKPTATIMNAAAHSKGFIITSSGLMGTNAYIIDSDGAPVWWATAPISPSRVNMSWDGSMMVMLSLNVQNTGGSVSAIKMDGTGAQSDLSGLGKSHHDFAAIPNGIATVIWNTTGMDPDSALVERTTSGTLTTIVPNLGAMYNSTTFHANAIHYYPADDSYTIGDRNPNLYVKITRKGALVWQLGGANPKDPSKFFTGVTPWTVNHGHHLLSDGTFLLFNNGPMMNGQSFVRGFKLDTATMTAPSAFTYMMSGTNSNVLGDVQRLPNGNTLVTFSNSGVIQEINPSGQLVASFKTTSFGYSEYRDSLYGPPPR